MSRKAEKQTRKTQHRGIRCFSLPLILTLYVCQPFLFYSARTADQRKIAPDSKHTEGMCPLAGHTELSPSIPVDAHPTKT